MKLDLKSTNFAIVAMLALAAGAVAFWMLVLSPKREESKKLGTQIEEVKASLAQHRAEAAEGLEARKEFPVDYQQLVVLGKAVPGGDDAASLLVELNQIAKRAEIKFNSFSLGSGSGGGGEAPAAPTPEAGGAPASPTEVAASLLPLGASIGPAGLAVMPYSLSFNGNFFQIADFIEGLDSLVRTRNAEVSVTGRLITIDSFSLAGGESGSSDLEASFEITTYVMPPEQGVTAGATPTAPAPSTATPAAATTGGAP